jgi:predicted DCC family thiol-disulfide oxidoreductase YuxK
MKCLYILYDSECELCRRCRIWLGRQPAYVPLVFVPFQSPEAECRFPGLQSLEPGRELLVISDAGDVWQGGAAWVMCLWALAEFREWSLRLAHPALLPLARRLCEVVSASRDKISRWLIESKGHEDLRQKLERLHGEACGPAGCAPPPVPKRGGGGEHPTSNDASRDEGLRRAVVGRDLRGGRLG